MALILMNVSRHMKNTLSSVWVCIASVLYTIAILIKTLCLVHTKKMTRHKADAVARYWSRYLLAAAQVHRQVIYQTPFKFEPGRAYIIMSNHSSLYDIPLIFDTFHGSVRMLAKKELFQIPLFGSALKFNEFPSIDRHHRQNALRDLELARAKMQDGIILWVAPEGTRSRNGELLPFKKGVFHLAADTKAIIVPVGIRGIHKVLPAKSWRCQKDQSVSIHIGTPIDTMQYEHQHRDVLMQHTRDIIEQLLGNKHT